MLLTGCDGFIGSHVARVARRSGWTVAGITRTTGGTAEVDQRMVLGPLSSRAPAGISKAVQRLDEVGHAAARVQLSGRPAPITRDNLASTKRLLDACARANRPDFVFLSSASALFEPRDQVGLTEDARLPARALGGYAASKGLCEELVLKYPGRSAILRPQAVIGPGDRSLMPQVLRAVRAGGWRWIGPPNGAATDLCSVENLAQACVSAADNVDATGVFHLSDGEALPMEAMFRTVFDALGLAPAEKRVPLGVALAAATAIETPLRWLRPRYEPPVTRFAVEVLGRTRTLDRSRALSDLGAPRITLSQGLDQAIDALRASP